MEQEQFVDNQIDLIIRNNKLARFTTEFSHTKDESRKKDLKEIMKMFETKNNDDIEKDAKSKLTQIYDDMNTFTLHGTWGKLSQMQKIDRIKEYVKSSVDKDKQEKAEKVLLGMLKDDELKRCVEYSSKDGKILSIKASKFMDSLKEYDSEESYESDCSE